MSPLKVIWGAVGAIVVVALLAFGLRGLGLVSFQVFGPKEEAARREVFEERQPPDAP